MSVGANEPTPDDLDAYIERTIGSVPRPLEWRRVRAVDARAEWAALDKWCRWLVNRYALDVREVPPCWYRHGAVVEELSALHGAWRVAYDPTQAASATADWHRALWDTRLRLRDWLSRTGCTVREHRSDTPPAWSAANANYADAFGGHVSADEETRRRAEIHTIVNDQE